MKIIIFIFISLGYFLFTPYAFAANVQVTGNINNAQINTSEGSVSFKESNTQNVVLQQAVDPTGKYFVSIPQGTYDITFIPASGSNLLETTIKNEKIDSNTVKNINVSSIPVSKIGKQSLIFWAVLIFGVLIFILTLFVFHVKKKK